MRNVQVEYVYYLEMNNKVDPSFDKQQQLCACIGSNSNFFLFQAG